MSPADLLYPLAIGVAEGGWIAVVYLLVDALSKVQGPLGFDVVALVAGGTCLIAARLDRLGLPRTALVSALALGGAVVGLLASGEARATLLAGDLLGSLGTDPGGALVGVAALRGFVRAGALRDPAHAGRPLLTGIVGLALAWVFGGVLPEPARSLFRTAAFFPTVAFVGGGLLAAGLARTDLAAADAGVDWRANRGWLVVLGGIVAALGLAAVPIGRGAERLMAAVIAWPASLPLLIFGLLIARILVPARGGVVRRAGAFTFGPLLALAVLAVISAVFPRNAPAPASPEGGAGGPLVAEPTTPIVDVVLIAISLLAVVGTLVFLGRAWSRNRGIGERPLGGEERHLAFPGREAAGEHAGRRRWLGRFGGTRPADAVAAYLATLRALEPIPELRRGDDETPAAHARRLHATGAGTLELDLLAADYQLARWGGRRITPGEERRAIGRWDRLRSFTRERAEALRRARPERSSEAGRAPGLDERRDTSTR